MSSHKKHLGEVLLMNIHNIYFLQRNKKKTIIKYFLDGKAPYLEQCMFRYFFANWCRKNQMSAKIYFTEWIQSFNSGTN